MLLDIDLVNIQCPKHKSPRMLSNCLYSNCEEYPCEVLSGKQISILENSLYTKKVATEFLPRRIKMYILEDEQGNLTKAPAGFNPEDMSSPGMEQAVKVYVIGKELQKQFRLVVVKPSAEQVQLEQVSNTTETTKKRNRK